MYENAHCVITDSRLRKPISLKMCTNSQNSHARYPCICSRRQIGDGRVAADGRHVAEVAVAERRRRLARPATRAMFCGRVRAPAGSRPARRPAERPSGARRAPRGRRRRRPRGAREPSGRRSRARGRRDRAARRATRPSGDGRHAGRPQDRAGLDRLAADVHASRLDLRDARCRSRPPRPAARARVARTPTAAPDSVASTCGPPSIRMMRADSGSIARKSCASACREISASAPASSTPVGPPPMTTNVSSRRWRAAIRLALGLLEREQHPPPHIERVLQRLEARRVRAPLVVPEVRVRGARRRRSGGRTATSPSAQVHDACGPGRSRSPRPARLARSSAGAESSGSATRCRRATAPPSRPGTAAAGTRDGCGGR